MTQGYTGTKPTSGNNDGIILAVGFVATIAVLLGLFMFTRPEFLTVKMYQFRFLDTITGGGVPIINEWRMKLDYANETQFRFKDMVQMSYITDLPFSVFVIWLLSKAKKHLAQDQFLYLKLRHRGLHVTDRGSNRDALTSILNYVTSPEKAGIYDLIKPIWGLDLLKQDPTKGGWASALKPHEVANRYNLLEEQGKPETLKVNMTNSYFMAQLGELYLGEESLADYHKALLGVWLALIERDAVASDTARNAIARSWSAKQEKIQPDYSRGLELWEKYKGSPRVAHLFKRHAYINTLMYGFFEYMKNERKVGRAVAHYYIWLKPLDRVLYYTLNNEGRDVEWSECAGVIIHWYFEKGMNRALLQPYTEDCILAFRRELGRVIPKIEINMEKPEEISVDGVEMNTLQVNSAAQVQLSELSASAEQAKNGVVVNTSTPPENEK